MCDDELGRGGDAEWGSVPVGRDQIWDSLNLFFVHNCFQSILAGHQTISK